jgi:hypothetical protein
MGKVSLICVIVIFALLLEDSSSVRKKSEEEKKEDEEVARAVNASLAEEAEKKRKEEDDEKKKQLDLEKKKNRTLTTESEKDEKKEDVAVKGKDQDEACPPLNSTCPEERTCPPCEDCPEGQDCPPCKKCGTCPPCGPCPSLNRTNLDVDCPAPPVCPGDPGLSLPAAIAVGAVTGVLVTGLAAAIGLILRYVDPIASGFLFMATIVIIWYLCSHYPETARELGGRAANLLREAAVAVSHRVMEAIRRHQEQVGFPVFSMPSFFF